MWPAPYDLTVPIFLRMLVALLAVGTVIKLLDGHADADYDRRTGTVTVTALLGSATFPYSLVLFAVAVGSNGKLALCLFFSAYAVGMLWDSRQPLPSGLAGWQESVLALATGVIFCGIVLQTWAVVAMLWMQCVDDLRDIHIDTAFGQSNLAQRFGYGEVVLAAVVLSILMFWWQPLLSMGFIGVAAGIEAGFPLIMRRWGTVMGPNGADAAAKDVPGLPTRTADGPSGKRSADRGIMQ